MEQNPVRKAGFLDAEAGEVLVLHLYGLLMMLLQRAAVCFRMVENGKMKIGSKPKKNGAETYISAP